MDILHITLQSKLPVDCKWHWDEVHDNANNDQVVKFYLTKGEHTLTFTYLMDQTRLDKILITNDLNYIPTEPGPGVKALFNTSSTTPSVKENVLFDASESVSSEAAIVTYQWDFGDGTKSTGKSANHTYNKPGRYNVQLIVTDDKGLISRLTKTLNVYTGDPVARFNLHSIQMEKLKITYGILVTVPLPKAKK